jgi:hypothetical protein
MGFPGEPGRDGNRGLPGIASAKGLYLDVCICVLGMLMEFHILILKTFISI